MRPHKKGKAVKYRGWGFGGGLGGGGRKREKLLRNRRKFFGGGGKEKKEKLGLGARRFSPSLGAAGPRMKRRRAGGMKAAGGAMAGRGPAAPRTPWERSGSVHSCPADVTWPRPPMGARGGALLKGQRGSGGAHMEGGRSPRVGLRRPRPHSYPRGTRGVKGPLTPSPPPPFHS